MADLIRNAIRTVIIVFLAGFITITASRAQGGYPATSAQPTQSGQAGQNAGQPAAPKVDVQEQADYKAFYDVPETDIDKKIQFGTEFIQKHPVSSYVPSVCDELVQLYYAKRDWLNFYATSDKVLALNPDDVNALVMVGWVIPHVYNAADPNAQAKLTKAEAYEKHALQLLAALTKPTNMTDEQFIATKSGATEQAHSGLGLVYFREERAADAVTELQQATTSTSTPDPSDLFVLGVELQQLNRNGEAADAFQKCSLTPGALQDRCKQSADQARKQTGTGR